jgi:hypothetical protein
MIMNARQLAVVRQLPALARSGNGRVARRYRREFRPATALVLDRREIETPDDGRSRRAVVELTNNEKRKRRCDGVRVLRLSSLHRRETKVPYLRLSGRWLEECGFPVGAPIYVKAERGKLIVTNEDPAAAVVAVN